MARGIVNWSRDGSLTVVPESRTAEILTGVFVLVALTLTGLLALWIAGGDPLGPGKKDYEVWMKDAGGVRAGDQVRMSGVEVGRVEEVNLRPGEEWPVVFRISVDKNLPMGEKSSARFASDGLLGGGFLAIDPGTVGDPPLPTEQPILGDSQGGIDRAMGRIDEVATSANRLLGEATELLAGMEERLGPLLGQIETLLSDENLGEARASLVALRQTLETTGPKLPALVVRLEAAADEVESGAKELPAVASEVRGLTRDLRSALGEDGERLAGVLDAAQGALGSTEGALEVVEGNSQNLETAIHDLREAAVYFKAFTRALQENPSRVLRQRPAPDRVPGEEVKP